MPCWGIALSIETTLRRIKTLLQGVVDMDKPLGSWTLEEVRNECERRIGDREKCTDCPMHGYLCSFYMALPGVSTHNPDEWDFE